MRRSSLVGVLGLLFASACTPTCERTCRKLLDCGTLDSERVSVPECEASCNAQLVMYDDWEDEDELNEAFDLHRECLVQSTCEQVEAGECYDERLFQVGVDPATTATTSLTTR